jgi:hypothetical protein
MQNQSSQPATREYMDNILRDLETLKMDILKASISSDNQGIE